MCSDSHTGSGGVFNCLARGVGIPDFDADDIMMEWIRARTKAEFECVYADADAKCKEVRKVDLGDLEPLVAFPDSVIENSKPVAAAAGTRIDQAFVGSCANGTLQDLALAAEVVRGHRVHPKT